MVSLTVAAVSGGGLVVAILMLVIVINLIERLRYVEATVRDIVDDGHGDDGTWDQGAINKQLGENIGQNADFGRQLAQRTIPELDALKDRIRPLEEYVKYDKADTRVQTLEEDLAAVNERNESYNAALQQQLGAKASETSVVTRIGYLENQIQNLQSRLPA